MEFIGDLTDLIQNTLYLDDMITSNMERDSTRAKGLVRRGNCFLKYTEEESCIFAPSRFIGYRANTLNGHAIGGPHGSRTTGVISRILGREPEQSIEIEEEFQRYCGQNSILPEDKPHKRSFWVLDLIPAEIDEDPSFPEGAESEYRHVRRERNARVRRLKIRTFRELNNGRLFCEACDFSFEDKYGSNFIECHHTIPLFNMAAGHMTKPQDLVLLCANCHRIVHRTKNWLSIDQLKDLLEIQRQKLAGFQKVDEP